MGFAYDGFDDGCVVEFVERCESRTGSVGRVGDYAGSGGFFSDEAGGGFSVGSVGRGQDRGGYEPGLGFGGYVSLVPVPFTGRVL